MKTFKEILLETIPEDCWWEDMGNLANTPIRYVEQAAKAYAEQFIDAAAEEILVDTSENTNRKIILKLKEQLK